MTKDIYNQNCIKTYDDAIEYFSKDNFTRTNQSSIQNDAEKMAIKTLEKQKEIINLLTCHNDFGLNTPQINYELIKAIRVLLKIDTRIQNTYEEVMWCFTDENHNVIAQYMCGLNEEEKAIDNLSLQVPRGKYILGYFKADGSKKFYDNARQIV